MDLVRVFVLFSYRSALSNQPTRVFVGGACICVGEFMRAVVVVIERVCSCISARWTVGVHQNSICKQTLLQDVSVSRFAVVLMCCFERSNNNGVCPWDVYVMRSFVRLCVRLLL